MYKNECQPIHFTLYCCFLSSFPPRIHLCKSCHRLFIIPQLERECQIYSVGCPLSLYIYTCNLFVLSHSLSKMTTTTTTAPPPPYMPTPSSSSASYTIQPAEQNQNPSHQQDPGMAESKQSYYGNAHDGHPAAQEPHQPGFSSQYDTTGAPNQQQPFSQDFSQQQEKAPRPAAAAAAGGPLTPLHLLNLNPALVDCPVCGERQVTRTEFESGNTT